MIAKEIMSVELCTVEPEATIAEASVLMGEHHIGSVLVIENDELVGILTERDVVRALSTTHDAPARPVVEWMTRKPVSASPTTDLHECLRVMLEGGFRHLPITEGSRTIGMLSMRDVARTLSQ
ncbi:MAG: CBS domain-containing protein [Actinomycetota bacterium]